MVKKILGGALVASALLLTSCGYTAEEQKFYDACVAKADKAATVLTLLKTKFGGEGDTAKKVCASIIEKANKQAKERGFTADMIKKDWETATRMLENL